MKGRHSLVLALALAMLASGCASQGAKPAPAASVAPPAAKAAQPTGGEQPGGGEQMVFRDPFLLRIYVDEKSDFEVDFDKPIPYVDRNHVVIFPGESFGLKLRVENGEIKAVRYQKDAAGADIALDFQQIMTEDKLKGSMMLKIQSHAPKDLYMEAVMRVPRHDGLLKTSILPVRAGKGDVETWPHPIVGLVLTHIRFEK